MTAKNAGSARVTRKSIDKYIMIKVECYVSIKVRALHVGATYSVLLLRSQRCILRRNVCTSVKSITEPKRNANESP